MLKTAVLKSQIEQYKRDYAQSNENKPPTEDEIVAAYGNELLLARRKEKTDQLANLLAQHAERFVAPTAVAPL